MIRLRLSQLVLVIAATLAAQVSPSQDLTGDQTADLIAKVKNVPVSSLHRGLPAIRFEDWVKARAGADAQSVSWTFRRGPAEFRNSMALPDCVDVHAMTKDGRTFWLSIGVNTNTNRTILFWHHGAVNVQKKSVSLEHLSQLPRLLGEADQKSHPSEALK